VRFAQAFFTPLSLDERLWTKNTFTFGLKYAKLDWADLD